jgi:hypothetical protein
MAQKLFCARRSQPTVYQLSQHKNLSPIIQEHSTDLLDIANLYFGRRPRRLSKSRKQAFRWSRRSARIAMGIYPERVSLESAVKGDQGSFCAALSCVLTLNPPYWIYG